MLIRRTQRAFNERPISLNEMSQIAFASYGLTEAWGNIARRTVPSAGAMYPLQLDYVVRRGEGMLAGVYRWAKQANGFIRYREVDDHMLEACFIGQEWMTSAVIQVISFDIARSAAKYSSRAHRFALLEAGHAAQNAILKATSLGLAAWEYGGYNDAAMMKLVELDDPTCGVATVLFYGHTG
ncbi:MAG TPA: SagB/ThcOx family dehydrogenase [Candidatus Saccharimonas sp.]|nr:SagB/ThcOx family dehydrogenase [Candidatus Saccharimonas sp.]